MSAFLYWFKFWKQPKGYPIAAFHGVLGGCVFSFVVFSPLWIALLEVNHG